jgi:hypothetical protein
MPLESTSIISFSNFAFMWPCIVTNFFVIKPTTGRCTNFTNLFVMKLRVSDSSSVHHQEFIHCKLNNGIYRTSLKEAFEQDQDGTWFHPGPARQLSTNLYGIYPCWVYSESTPDDGQTNCPKHVEFSWQNKFVKLVHLVGFIEKKYNFQFLKISKDEMPDRQTAHVGATLAHLTFKSCHYIMEWPLGKISNLFL